MLRILLVDDMPIFLEYLRGCIDWEAYGFTICAEAHDGREALEKIESCDPDVLLADITMPYVNGLELARIAAQKYPDLSTILITGNSEFEYARQAVKIGVCDYIVKPFEKEELILSLLKLRDNMNRALETKNRQEELASVRREEALRTLILSTDETTMAQTLSQLGVSFQSGRFLICVLHFHAGQALAPEQMLNWEAIVIRLISGMVDRSVRAELCRDFECNIVLILNFADEEAMKAYRAYELQDLARILKGQLGLECRIGVSDYCYALREISLGYRQALQALSGSTAPVADYKKLRPGQESAFCPPEAIERLNRALALRSEAQAEQVLREEWQQLPAGDSGAGDRFLLSMLSALMVDVVNAGRNTEDVFGPGGDPYEQLAAQPDAAHRLEAVIACCKTRIRYEKDHAEGRSHSAAEKAKAYIQEHCADAALSIPDISRALLLNQTYLRRMFKDETGLTLTEYITKYRLEQAQRLIRDTGEPLAAIAEKTGYSDVSYFSRSFKKYFGVSPKMARGERN